VASTGAASRSRRWWECEHNGGSDSMADLAELLSTVDEFLGSPHVSARLDAFLSAAVHPHPGYHADQFIDEVSFAALRLRQQT
jgi:hypothetical protein